MCCYEERLYDHHEACMLPQVISVVVHAVNASGIGTYLAAVQPSHVEFRAHVKSSGTATLQVGSRCCVE